MTTTTSKKRSLTIDGQEVSIQGDESVLELARRSGIEIPTFCYHSQLSVYGACRLCFVDIAGRGLATSCSTPAEAGMEIRTTTSEIRELRRTAVELMLANHESNCPTCPRSDDCQLQSLARRLGIQKLRFASVHEPKPLDRSSAALHRDPNKCVLCGDCVRMCSEVQSIGAIDFAGRGKDCEVAPAFGKPLGEVECVGCGQCAVVCPVGALAPASEVDDVWQALADPDKVVVAQIAPAVRVALGESFGLDDGTVVTGALVAALRRLGFDRVYDTAYAADITVWEEGEELLGRLAERAMSRDESAALPQLSSCCPAWVRFAEQYYPELLPHLSSCRSPQQILGALAHDQLPAELDLAAQGKELVVVSLMPCTAKKEEARLSKFQRAGKPDVAHVLTTVELVRMIEEAGIDFRRLSPESLDMPLGFKTGAGVLFGASGGVTEAVLRYAAERLGASHEQGLGEISANPEDSGVRRRSLEVGEQKLRVAVVHGLANARRVAEDIRAGREELDFVEVMACPGGCVGGGGQPLGCGAAGLAARREAIGDADRMLQLHAAQDNHFVSGLYAKELGAVGGDKAHTLFHTHFRNRRRIRDEDLALITPRGEHESLLVRVCVGTNCHLRGAQTLLQQLLQTVEQRGLDQDVRVEASFCFERCDRGPSVCVGDEVIEKATLNKVLRVMDQALLGGLPKVPQRVTSERRVGAKALS